MQLNRSLWALALSVIASGLLAQSEVLKRDLVWLSPQAVGPEKDQYQPQLKNGSIHSNYFQIPVYCEALPKSFGENDSISVRVISSSPVLAKLKQAFKGVKLGQRNSIEFENNWGYEGSTSRLSYCLTPFFRENGVVYRVDAFELQRRKRSVVSLEKRGQGGRSKQLVASKLASGTWHKLRISESGVYKITAAFMSDNGISKTATNFSDIRILSNDLGTLPERFTESRPQNLQERPFKVVDQNNDGVFNQSDYIVLYAFGPHEWSFDDSEDRYDYKHNIYRDQNYIFISTDAGPAMAISNLVGSSNPTTTVTAFDDFAAVEEDLINLVGTGRNWFGDVFEFTLSYNYNFAFPNIDLSEVAKLHVNVVGRSSTSGTSIQTSYTNQTLLTNGIASYSTFGDYPPFVERTSQRTTFTPSASNITLNLTYNNGANPGGVAWLDRIELNVRRQLDFLAISNQLIFRDSRSLAPGQSNTYKIANAPSDIEVWQVNRLGEYYLASGTFQTDGSFEFVADATELREFVAFRGSNFPEPDYIGLTAAQNLHGIEVPEMIIVSHPSFKDAAQELADYHNSSDNVITAVVTTDEIYNEYGSGGQDLTAIRDFVKDLYSRSTNGQFKYVLLFGDASYDYKDRINGNNNFVPTWQSGYSFSLGLSSITDDFFAYMDAGEATVFSGAIMDLGVGRVPAANLSQAQVYVNKVKHYGQGENRFAEWRNRILLMADDVDEPWERTYFVPRSEVLFNKAKAASNAFNVQKIYQDSYQQETSTGSQSYPEAQRDMFRTVQTGCLLTNYIGHGGEIGLSSEKLLQLSDVNGWTNYDALSLFITITCEFTRYDDPKRVSAGEQLLLNPNGGAIALLSTTRVVGVQGAVDLNEAIFDTILARPNGTPQTLGQIIKAAKNDNFVVSRGTKTKFSLIGDPALRLAIPTYGVKVTTLNAAPIQLAVDTIKALSFVQLEGEVTDNDDVLLNDFDGILNISIYDKEGTRQTLVNDGVGAPVNFKEQKSLLYRGKVEVLNGKWTVEFRAPLGLNYQFGFGKISMYAYDEVSGRDAAGAYDSVLVGGYNANAPEDNLGPEIKLFMNDGSFVSGGITGTNPFIYAELRDSSGINTVGNGVGQDLRAVLNRANDQPFILNEFYEADLNSYKSGQLRYQLFDLEPGSYQLNLRAFDIHNNPSEATTDFVVAESADLALDRVLNYPNPFTTYTEFHFEHNRSNQPLQVQVQIFTVSGKLVKTINQEVQGLGNRVTGISWNGLDDFGDKIGKGVYVYRLKVKSLSDNSTADVYEKLVVLR